MKIIGIIGSRSRNTQPDLELAKAAFLKLYENGDQIVSGGCPQGGDAFAEWIAKRYQVPITIFYAQWDKLGKRAGFARNDDIARIATHMIALVAEDRTGGTEDSIKKFMAKDDDAIFRTIIL